jgi:hypothetical protein
MKLTMREFRMLLLVTMTAPLACAPSVGEVGGESDSNAIVASGGAKKFQAIVPLFNYEKRELFSYSSAFFLAKESKTDVSLSRMGSVTISLSGPMMLQKVRR